MVEVESSGPRVQHTLLQVARAPSPVWRRYRGVDRHPAWQICTKNDDDIDSQRPRSTLTHGKREVFGMVKDFYYYYFFLKKEIGFLNMYKT